MNFREGDFEAIAQIFPELEPSVAIRRLVSAFVDRHMSAEAKALNIPLPETTDE